MLSKDMSIGEINNLNYSGLSSDIDVEILKQCIPSTKERKRFMDNYSKVIGWILYDCNVLYELWDFADNHKTIGVTGVFPCGSEGSVVVSSASLIINISSYLFEGKNSALSDLYKYFETPNNNHLSSNELASNAFREVARTVRKQLIDIEKSGQYDIEKIKEDYSGIVDVCCMNLSKKNSQYKKTIVDIKEVVHEGIELLTKLIFANKVMFEKTLEYSIDLDKYNIDKDKYAFCIFSQHLGRIENYDEKSINRLIYPILSYFDATRDEDTSNLFYYAYNPETNNYDVKYTYKDFIKKLQDYIKSHRDINCDILPFDYFKGWDDKEVDEFLNLFTEETLENFKEIDPEVLFLPTSRGVSTESRNNTMEAKEKVFSLLPLEKREFYSKNKDKIHVSLLGEKKFKGYILNVLNNGYVIFEKYDTKEGDISSKSGAAYIMNIFNFKSLYTMDIREVRDFIKSQDKSKPLFDRVDYKCHMGNWQEHIQKYFDEDTGINSNDVEEVLSLEKVRAIQYKKEIEEE